jgi:hypothetical protein
MMGAGPDTGQAPCCRLCGGDRTELFWQDRRRDYFRCADCRLVFVPPWQYLAPVDEKAEYDRHCNHPGDAGYRRFLGRLFEPLRARLAPGSRGLDFGSGPGPALSVMFAQAGYAMQLYDCFYAPERGVLHQHYDFITASEVVEHLHRPGEELDRLWALLRPGGLLGVMTKLVLNREAFARWHYKNDMTHVSFFSRDTFVWLAARWRAEMDIIGADVIIFRRPS